MTAFFRPFRDIVVLAPGNLDRSRRSERVHNRQFAGFLALGENSFFHLRLYGLQSGAYVTLIVHHEQNIHGHSATWRSVALP
jgi:hypothetical protein